MPSKLTTKQFSELATAKHEGKYSYNNVIYINSNTKVCITCPSHGEFLQKPGEHLIGKGCSKCANEKTSARQTGTTKTFKEKAMSIHGNKYSYENVAYVNSTKKVSIICPVHGEFKQSPTHHLAGRGCKNCNTGRTPETQQEFIKKAIEKHSGKYSYDKTIYVKSNIKVSINCHKHGVFWQTPSHHLKGNGCPICATSKKTSTKEQFLTKSNEIHKNYFDYSKVLYISNKDKVIIICPEHGEFMQAPSDHLSGKGCRKCGFIIGGQKGRMTTEEFIKKSNELHNNKYIYTKTIYTFAVNKLTITCPTHGDFQQQAQVHLQGHGCYNCKIIKPVSSAETKLFEFVKQYAPDAIQSVRGLFNEKSEVDIYIPSMNIAIEYNGLFFHSDRYSKTIKYHQEKTDLLKNKGIRLIHIFDDEWVSKRTWCENYLKRLLGVKQKVIYARKCTTSHLKSKDVREFLEEYHLQGAAGKDAMAFYHNGEMVAVATTRKTGNGKVELARWCVKFGITLHGGLGKVIKHLPFDISYCDTAKHDGHGYIAAGMKLLRISQPSYWYTNGKVRKSRIDFQKHKLMQNPKAIGNTEKELANSLNWYAIGGLQQLVFGH